MIKIERILVVLTYASLNEGMEERMCFSNGAQIERDTSPRNKTWDGVGITRIENLNPPSTG